MERREGGHSEATSSVMKYCLKVIGPQPYHSTEVI